MAFRGIAELRLAGRSGITGALDVDVNGSAAVELGLEGDIGNSTFDVVAVVPPLSQGLGGDGVAMFVCTTIHIALYKANSADIIKLKVGLD